jgi:hypothetical protein
VTRRPYCRDHDEVDITITLRLRVRVVRHAGPAAGEGWPTAPLDDTDDD